jgi:NAD(P)-dependent dehydrogenase (short-subunit alcohol dehydrogenase family)
MITQRTLIIGANSDIGKAIAVQVSHSESIGLIIISRDTLKNTVYIDDGVNNEVSKITVQDYLATSIEQAIKKIAVNAEAPITRVFICNGILHSDDFQPEKRLEEIDPTAFIQVMTANALTPLLWIQKLTPILAGKTSCKIVVFSARVGSISDNRLGGWYSYRASKTALNMMLKTASIELARRAKNIKIIIFHPGTTDTPLSKPFQKNVPENKLFTSEFVATQLLQIVEKTALDGTASYLDWQGKSINW